MIQDSLFRAGSSLFIVDREFVHNPLKLPIELDPGAATFGQNPRDSLLISLLAALVGIPHRTLGEEPGAVVTLKPGAKATEAELREFIAARLAAFKVPVKVAFWPEPLPRNPTGKILKNELKRLFGA